MANSKLKTQNSKLRGQVTLELALSIFCVLLLLLGSVQVCVWVNKRLVLRQEDYEQSAQYGRIAAGSMPFGNSAEVQVDETGYPNLDIFGENQ